jgi:hypothetical protein
MEIRFKQRREKFTFSTKTNQYFETQLPKIFNTINPMYNQQQTKAITTPIHNNEGIWQQIKLLNL